MVYLGCETLVLYTCKCVSIKSQLYADQLSMFWLFDAVQVLDYVGDVNTCFYFPGFFLIIGIEVTHNSGAVSFQFH